jgi:hypothetical protein
MAEAVKAVEMVVVTAVETAAGMAAEARAAVARAAAMGAVEIVETAVGMAAEARAEAVNADVVPVVGKARVEREARLVAAARMSRSF